MRIVKMHPTYIILAYNIYKKYIRKGCCIIYL